MDRGINPILQTLKHYISERRKQLDQSLQSENLGERRLAELLILEVDSFDEILSYIENQGIDNKLK